MSIPCLFEIDPQSREATGTVAPFCSEACRHQAKASLDFPDHTEGVSSLADFGFAPTCVQCGAEIVEQLVVATERSMPSKEEILDVVIGHHKALARLLAQYDPDSTEADWLGESNELVIKLTGRSISELDKERKLAVEARNAA